MAPARQPKQAAVIAAAGRWWKEQSAQHGPVATLRKFAALLWEFGRDSLPSRRRQRYGDVDYDWDHRVDTTSATVGWRNRLLGMLHSPYQPSEPELFWEMLTAMNIDFREFVFIDIGSGKGRALLMAADYPFRRIVGVELLPELHEVAVENIGKYKSESQKCFAIESVCGDALEFALPLEPVVIYLFNPLPEAGLREFLNRLERSLREHPRRVVVLYHNPVLEGVVAKCGGLRKIGGTHQYAIFENALAG